MIELKISPVRSDTESDFNPMDTDRMMKNGSVVRPIISSGTSMISVFSVASIFL